MSNDAGAGDTPSTQESAESRRRFPRIIPRSTAEADERLADRLAERFGAQWAMVRDQRRSEPAPIATGPSNLARAQVPWGVDLAAAWAWRFLVICAAGYLIFRVLGFFSVIVLPIVVALLIAALVSPVVRGMRAIGLPAGLAAAFVVIGGIAFVTLMLTFAGQQVANGASDLADQTAKGIGQIKDWLRDGPLNASDSQINDYLERAQAAITERSQDGALTQAASIGSTVGHVVAGFFIVLFALFFFLADGARIWSWVVRIAPRAAREHVDASGHVAWRSLTQFVRATVIVAAVDAIGIMIVAAVLGVPFVLAIGVLVFLGAFIPMVGATIAGAVAVLVALVDQGPVTALLMLGGVILVQQIEGHVLQPFLMGRFVSVHPLGVIVAIGCGVLVAGIAGALVSVPLAAAVNAVVHHLASEGASVEDQDDGAVGDHPDPDELEPSDRPETSDVKENDA